MKHLKIILVFLTLSINVNAQYAMKIKHDAEEIAKAVVSNDFKTVVKYTHPIVIRMVGGPDKMIALMNKGLETMKAQGAAITGSEIGEPGKILNTKTALYSVVPQKVTMTSNGTKFYSTSSLLAISSNNGASWYFVDAGNITDAQIKQIFPEIYGKLTIPKRSEPVVIGQ
ncbi:MAG: hypothetical protein V4553_15910 [Bacteroidota bacterium]